MAERTHCRRGHALDDANTYMTPSGERQCRACRRAANRAYRQRQTETPNAVRSVVRVGPVHEDPRESRSWAFCVRSEANVYLARTYTREEAEEHRRRLIRQLAYKGCPAEDVAS